MSLLIIFRDNGLGHCPEGLVTPGVILRDAGLNFSLCLVLSSTRCRSPALRTPGSKEVSSWTLCSFVQVHQQGESQPTSLDWEKEDRSVC